MSLEDTVRTALAKWTVEERDEWEERAAIMEYDGGLSRKEAEIAAFFSCRKAMEARKHDTGHDSNDQQGSD